MRVACVVLATLALLASSSFALDDAADAAAPSPAGNPGASADAAGGFPTTTDVNLMRWISEKGGAFAGVGVYSFIASSDDSDVADARYGSRAMYAKEAEVPDGAEVFRLPSSAVIIAHSEAAGSACLNRLASLDPEWALAAMILRERSARHASPHAAFIDAMYAHPPPGARVGKMPRGSDADAALRETRAGHLLAGWRDDYARGWLALDTLCIRKRPTEFSAEYFNPRSFEEALAMVHAASVRIPVDDLRRDDESRERRAKDGAKTATRAETSRLAAALVPIAHLMPHDPRGTAPCVTVHEDGATLVVKAAAGAPGTELACNRAPPRDSRVRRVGSPRDTAGRSPPLGLLTQEHRADDEALPRRERVATAVVCVVVIAGVAFESDREHGERDEHHGDADEEKGPPSVPIDERLRPEREFGSRDRFEREIEERVSAKGGTVVVSVATSLNAPVPTVAASAMPTSSKMVLASERKRKGGVARAVPPVSAGLERRPHNVQ